MTLQTDPQRLETVLRRVAWAVREQRGFFQNGWRTTYLPQWNLPTEMEHSPLQREVKLPYEAALWLFTRTYMDRLTQSRHLARAAKQAWENRTSRWIFFPGQVIGQPVELIDQALREYFAYALPLTPMMSAGAGYQATCRVVTDIFDGDPRTIIQGTPVNKALERLQLLPGFGPGIARLYMTELCDRNIARPSDPELLENKIDRHKASLLFNTNVVQTDQAAVAMSSMQPVAQVMYARAFQQPDLDVITLDAALWVIGSEGCATKNHAVCSSLCPLSAKGYCSRNVGMDHTSGAFLLRDEQGNSIDRRGPRRQLSLDFYGVQSV